MKKNMMKKATLVVASLSLLALVGCGDKKTTGPTDPENVSVLDTANVDYRSADPQAVYFSFATGKTTSISANAWDLSISNATAEVIANCGPYGSGVRLFKTTHTDISHDFSDLEDSVQYIIEGDVNPLAGAYSQQGAGSDTVYLVKDAAGDIYKVQFTSFGPAGQYSLKIAKDLSGTAKTLSGTLDTAYDHVYLDLSTTTEVSDQIPQKDSWDLQFVRALEFNQGPNGFGPRSAILVNAEFGAKAKLLAESELDSAVTPDFPDAVDTTDFIASADAIGASWYVSEYDPVTHISTVTVPAQTYLVRTTAGTLALVQFLTFNGPQNEGFYTVFKWLGE